MRWWWGGGGGIPVLRGPVPNLGEPHSRSEGPFRANVTKDLGFQPGIFAISDLRGGVTAGGSRGHLGPPRKEQKWAVCPLKRSSIGVNFLKLWLFFLQIGMSVATSHWQC